MLSVILLRQIVPSPWVVTSLGAAVSIGMVGGAIVSWAMLVRAVATWGSAGNGNSGGRGGPAAAVAGGLVAWFSRPLLEAGIGAAVLGAAAAAIAATALFGLLVFGINRRLLGQLWALRNRSGEVSEVS